MKTQKLLALFLSCLIFSQISQAQTSTPASTDEVRVARLAGLAKVWGAVKFFHPYLAYREIDWDKALIDTLPKVNNAKTSQEYEAAVNHMLAVLDDRNTRAESAPHNKTSAIATDQNLVRKENGVVVIDVARIAVAIVEDVDKLGTFVTSIREALPGASGIVIDARGDGKKGELDQELFDIFIRQAMTTILDSNVVLGSMRYRMHNGYASQIGSGSTSYSSSFVTSAPQVLVGQAKTKTPPIAIIVNQHSLSFAEIMSGLQAANRAVVIQAGERAPETGGSALAIKLPDNINVRIRTSEIINPDGSVDLQPDTVVTNDEALKEAMRAVQEDKMAQRPKRTVPPLAANVGQQDKSYADMKFPLSEYRLLALFRFWNVINYFFPYKNLIGDSWETVLPRYIPKFEANKDVADYQFTVREMVTEIRDSHGFTRNTDLSIEKLGRFQPAMFVGYVEEKTIVTKVLDDKLPVKVGDEVLAIDDEPVEKKREFLSRYFASSTPQYLMRVVHFRLLLGPKERVAKLKLRGVDGQLREVALPRTEMMGPKLAALVERTTPVMQVLPQGFGYVDLARLQGGEVDKMFETIKNTPAVIFDMRGYPNGTAWTIAPRLTEKENVVAALFSRPLLEAPTLSNPEYAGTAKYSFAQKIPERKGDVYRGKVVMLINEDAISQAEHTCLFFESATDVTFIGTPTAGANGDITFMVLPGNVAVSFSGHEVRHADGRQLQRVGIQPTVRVAPTIRGIVEGRDEILERAIKYLGRQ